MISRHSQVHDDYIGAGGSVDDEDNDCPGEIFKLLYQRIFNTET